MTRIMVNGKIVEMSAEEKAIDDKFLAENKIIYDNEKKAEEAKEDLKASAKAKLVAGEALTQEEADTIVL